MFHSHAKLNMLVLEGYWCL